MSVRPTLPEHLLQLGERRRPCECGERSLLRDLARGREEAAPRRACECASDADPANAEVAELFHGGEVIADEHVQRLRCYGRDEFFDGLEVENARRVKT